MIKTLFLTFSILFLNPNFTKANIDTVKLEKEPIVEYRKEKIKDSVNIIILFIFILFLLRCLTISTKND